MVYIYALFPAFVGTLSMKLFQIHTRSNTVGAYDRLFARVGGFNSGDVWIWRGALSHIRCAGVMIGGAWGGEP
jgi:hypothetical protein